MGCIYVSHRLTKKVKNHDMIKIWNEHYSVKMYEIIRFVDDKY